MKNRVYKNIDTAIISREAIKRGIKVRHLNNFQDKKAFLELSYKKHYEYFVGEKSSLTSSTASYAVNNKALTKSLLSRAKINVAEGKLFNKNMNIKDIYKYIEKIGYPVVIKKNDGAHGNLVFVGMKNKKMCKEAIDKVLEKNEEVLVEKKFSGEEFRFIASRNKFIAATKKIPANVVGDGIHKIEELIDIKNSHPSRGYLYEKPLTKIKIDDAIIGNLCENNLKLTDILPRGRKIFLRKNANLSTGGDSIDVTDQVHSNLKKITIDTVRAIPGLAYAGVDLMTNQDLCNKPTKKSYIVIEINSSPGIRMHHFPYKGKNRNVAKEILDELFPETKNNMQ
jgi:cyanophycin synthetase